MDDQNPKPEPLQPIIPENSTTSTSIGGRKVIQPTEAILEHLKSQSSVTPTQAPHVIQPSPGLDSTKTAPVPPSATPAVITPTSQPENYPAQFANPAGPSAVVGGTLIETASIGKQQSLRNKILLIVVGSIVLLGIIAAVLFVTLHKTSNKNGTKASSSSTNNVIPPGFKSITYDNNLGSTFQLLFYSDYTYAKSGNGQTLQSNVSKNGQSPLTLVITEDAKPENSIQSQLLNDTINCVATFIPIDKTNTLHIKNAAAGSTVNMCAVDNDLSTVPGDYLGLLKADNNYYGISIIEKMNLSIKPNLLVYKNDITTIVSSIKVVSSKAPSQPNSTPGASQESSNVFTSSGVLEPSNVGSGLCGSIISPENTFVAEVTVSGSASCNDAGNVISDATTEINGGNFSGFGYKCTSVTNGAGYKYASHWAAERTHTFYSYNCKDGSNQIAFNWETAPQ
jgi:hypothetical protein